MFKFGLIGAGRSAIRLVRCIDSIEGAQISHISAETEYEATKFADNHAIGNVCKDYKELIQIQEIKAIIVSVPHFLHYQMVKDALNAGKHVMCEKPFTIDIENGRELISLAEKKGLKIGIIFQKRFHDAMLKAKELIDKGKLGKIIQTQINVFWKRDPPYFEESKWRNKWKTAGGGALMTQSIHFIDLLIWFLGDPELISALYGTLIHDIEVEDNAAVLLKFQDSIFTSIQVSTSVAPNFPGIIRIYGTEGSINIKGFKLTFMDKDGKVLTFPDPYPDMSVDEFKNIARVRLFEEFIGSIRQNRPTKIDGKEGLKAVKIIKDIYEYGQTFGN